MQIIFHQKLPIPKGPPSNVRPEPKVYPWLGLCKENDTLVLFIGRNHMGSVGMRPTAVGLVVKQTTCPTEGQGVYLPMLGTWSSLWNPDEFIQVHGTLTFEF